MSGQSIAAEVEAAYRSLGPEVGDGRAFTVTLIEPGEGQANPWDEPGAAATEHGDIPAMLGTVPDEWIDGTLIRADDELLMIAGTAPKVEEDWTVRMKGKDYTIQAIRTMKPAGVPITYTLVLRR